MQVHVDPDRCQGHSRCYDLAPELFDVDELGNGYARGDGTVAPGLEEKARLVEINCPEEAVIITEGDAR